MKQFNNLTIKQYNNKTKGVSLVEALVVIFIILLLSALVVLNPRRQVDLDLAVRQLVSDLRRAQNMAMVAEEQGGTVPCGYGIYFNTGNKNIYILFADVVGSCNKIYDSGTDIIINGSSIDLPSGVQISNGSNFNVFFETPHGATTIPSNPFDIGLLLTGVTRTIRITLAGKIEIQ